MAGIFNLNDRNFCYKCRRVAGGKVARGQVLRSNLFSRTCGIAVSLPLEVCNIPPGHLAAKVFFFFVEYRSHGAAFYQYKYTII
jgi:hypothetical protein